MCLCKCVCVCLCECECVCVCVCVSVCVLIRTHDLCIHCASILLLIMLLYGWLLTRSQDNVC